MPEKALSRGLGLLGTAGRALRNSPVAASVAARRLGADPLETVVRVAERAPGRLVDPVLVGPLAARPETALLRAEADEVADRVADDPGLDPATLRRLVAIATAQNRTALAERLLDRLPHDDPHRARLAARLDWRLGRLEQARDDLADAPDRRSRRTAASMADDLAVLAVPTGGAAPAGSAGLVLDPGRVLHLVTNSLPWANAGYTTRTHQILRAQQQVGLDPHALTRLGFPVAQGVLTASSLDVVDGVPYHRSLPLRPLPASASARLDLEVAEAGRLVERLRPGVLHAASNHWNGRVALALRDRYGIPVVYEVRGFLEESWLSRRDGDEAEGSSTDRYRLERALETWVMGRADLVTTLGEVMKAEIVARGVDPDRVLVAPNAVDDRFLAPAPSAGALRASLGIADDEPVVGVVSTLYRHEGITTLVDAVALLTAQHPRVRLLVVGDGPEREAIAHRVAEAGLADRAVLTGRVPFDRVHEYYAAIDVFCVPRVRARVSDMVTPLKPVEAMATARAVVGSDVGGLREVISDTVTGVLVEPDDARALAEGIAPLLYDEALRHRLGEAARSWVAEHRTWVQVATRYREAYARLGAG